MSEIESNQWFNETGKAFIIYPVKDMVNSALLVGIMSNMRFMWKCVIIINCATKIRRNINK